MTNVEMKQTVLTGPSILIFGQISVPTFDQVQTEVSRACSRTSNIRLIFCRVNQICVRHLNNGGEELYISNLVKQKSLLSW